MEIESKILHLMDDPQSKERGFRLLMTTYQKDIYWHIRSMVKSHQDTDDVIQNTFIKVFRYYDRFKKESSLFTWIHRIATNEALTHLKKNKKRHTEDIQQVFHLSSNDHATMDGDQIASKLNTVLESLPEKQKKVFQLRYFEEMPYKKMSMLLKTSEGALKASYHIAVKKIESELIK